MLISKRECVPGLRGAACSHQVTSYLNIPFLKVLQETGLGRNDWQSISQITDLAAANAIAYRRGKGKSLHFV